MIRFFSVLKQGVRRVVFFFKIDSETVTIDREDVTIDID